MNEYITFKYIDLHGFTRYGHIMISHSSPIRDKYCMISDLRNKYRLVTFDKPSIFTVNRITKEYEIYKKLETFINER